MNSPSPPAPALVPRTATDQLLRITPLADRAGLRIEGEVDYATLPALRRALASMGGGSFIVDLGGLAFIDVGGLRALVTTAAALHDDGSGHVLTLRSAPWHVQRLLNITGWHKAPGLRLHAPSPGPGPPGHV
ncbi:STAS domain-containing protein [Spongiactinospora sp. TRM90649]|uniref:STAS domain-containing protein n=1 Tax=Spongiactinospora sp. TRM90649 TaxID=3031114 RepID=UPI0023F6A2E1|nr:STAS domain-containing protein [Spongiactinospora sp. TRM90649]MDF5754629.1 STAS domain-containing protein [Spongiactinospora sp. TRM90649]